MTNETKWRVNYVDLMATWSGLLIVLYICSSCLIGVKAFVEGGYDSLLLCLVAPLLMIGIIWLPGLILATFLDECYPCLALTNAAYQNPQQLFAGGIRQIRKRFKEMGGTSCLNLAFMVETIGLAVAVVGVFTVSVILNSENAMLVALCLGTVLSWGGALVIVPRLIYDFLRGRHQMRWIS